jgi:hypothetical protein
MKLKEKRIKTFKHNFTYKRTSKSHKSNVKHL